MATAKQIVKKALSYVGTYDGGCNNIIFNTHYYGHAVSGEAYPWCCAFVWDIFRMCEASNLFNDGQPTAYCPTVVNWGRRKGLSIGKKTGQYGDIVLFDWNGDGVADHIGIILSKNSDGSYWTIEGNTANSNFSNGGYVLKMLRYQYQICEIIRPQYDGSASEGEAKDVYYQVFTSHSGWLPVVKNLEDYAGKDGESIQGIKVFADNTGIDVSIHYTKSGNIDTISIDGGSTVIKYRVRCIGDSNYLDYMENKKDTGGSKDTFAGIKGKLIDRIQICCK